MGILVSAVLSLHNRSKLFKRALEGYLWQTMPRTDFELILVDDMSSEDLSKTYEHLKDEINLRHVKIDHTRHFVYKQRNPRGAKGNFENWYHTPAISINVGCHLARGSVICLCHPEILHAPWNFERAYERLKDKKEKAYLFGTTYLGDLKHNAWMDEKAWSERGWNGFVRAMTDLSAPEPLRKFRPNELYWYLSFLPKDAVVKIGGVDFSYLNGAAGEDDDFKERVRLAGWPPVYASEIEGFHQDHSDEKEAHRQRTTKFWDDGLKYNRTLFKTRTTSSGFPMPANRGFNWTASECIVSETGYSVKKARFFFPKGGDSKLEMEPPVRPVGRRGSRIERIFTSVLMGDEPKIGVIQAFQGIFGIQNVRIYDFMKDFRNGVPKEDVNEEFYREVLKVQPDWIWLQVHDTDVLQVETFERIKGEFPHLVISHWMGDMRRSISAYLSSICQTAHLTLISNVGQAEDFKKAGARRVEYCPVALDWDYDVQGQAPWDKECPRADVIFCGNQYVGSFPGARERAEAILALVNAGIDIKVVGSGWESWVPVIYSTKRCQQYHIYREGKIALSINNFNDIERYYSNRMFVALASGKPVVAQYVPGMEKDFTLDENCLWYKKPAELVQAVKRLLDDEALRKRIGANGRALAIQRHTWFNRIFGLLPIIEEISGFH